jgi:hypothetical protein
LNLFLPWLREDKRAGSQTQRNLDFARNPKLSRFDQNTVLAEAHNSRWDFMHVFREQTGALLPAEQGYDQEACSRMVKAVPTGTMKITDSGREANH